ncbi:MAG: hypothetical protein KBE04_07660 [Phycisphaerae bacterium]|nr:hypothetical protein [Phycisphaerae bacterium]
MDQRLGFWRNGFWVSAWIVALVLAGESPADYGRGLALKAGVQTLTSPLTGEDTSRTRLELEISTARLLDGYVDVALAIGGSSLGALRESQTSEDEGLIIDEYSEDRLRVWDVRVSGRFYPLGEGSHTLTPYMGGGLGYYQFVDVWEDDVYAYDPISGIGAGEYQEGTETVADGFFPFLMAGLNVSVSDRVELFGEVAYDFEKDDEGYDLGGPIYLLGCRIRF